MTKSIFLKKDLVVWRGATYHQNHRLRFLEACSSMDFIDAGNTALSKGEAIPFAKPRLSIKDQLNYKFILSLEGNDVATNLKWIMSSNSVCIMPRPKFETWFKEGTLKPNYHYIEIKDDYTDIEVFIISPLIQTFVRKSFLMQINIQKILRKKI